MEEVLINIFIAALRVSRYKKLLSFATDLERTEMEAFLREVCRKIIVLVITARIRIPTISNQVNNGMSIVLVFLNVSSS